MIRKRLRNFVSKIDQFQTEFDNTHTPSASQLAEISKYKKINRLRDRSQKKEEKV